MKDALKFTISLNSDQLKELIEKFVELEYGIKNAEVSLEAATKYIQYESGEGVPYVSGAKISASLDSNKLKTTASLQYPPGVR